MMSLNGLLAALTAQVEAEAERKLAEARDETDRIRDEAAAAAERKREQALADREAELRERAEARLAETRRRTRAEVLGARSRMLDALRAAARQRIADLAGDGAPEAARTRHAEEALAYVEDERAVLRCPAAWMRAVRAAGDSSERIRIESDDALTGVQVIAREGALLVDNTLEGRLDRFWPQLAIEILRRLEASP